MSLQGVQATAAEELTTIDSFEETVSANEQRRLIMEPEYNILNHTKDAANLQETVPPLDISLKLQRSMLQLKGHHMTEDGHGIDYERLRESELFREYIDLSTRLVTCDPSSLDHTHKMAFFISILK